jgi:hypothetical protein
LVVDYDNPEPQPEYFTLAHFIFSNEKYLELIAQLGKEQREVTQELLTRLGVRARNNDIVTIIVVAHESFDGHGALFDLLIEAQEHFGKRIILGRVRHVVVRDVETLSKSPHLERAAFIMVLGEDLPEVEHYPELGRLLPFVE